MSYSVLIVDDCAAMQAIIRRVLTLSGLEVRECLRASSGEEALEMLHGNWVDLVLTDVNMPGMGGEELLRRVMEDPELKQIPVVVVSSDSTHTRAHRLLGMGARGYVVKPFQPEALRTELERVLGVETADPNLEAGAGSWGPGDMSF
jgi:two-component system, chemotaxis family, chemotaxis protein CheY